MKEIDLAQAIGILANVGVIAGIVFLGLELRQNNALLQAQSRSNFLGARLQVNSAIAESAWLPEIFAKVRAGETLSEDEAIRLQAQHQVIFTLWQWTYEDYTSLRLEPPGERLRAIFAGQTLTPQLAATWEVYKATVDPEFAEWVDQNIVDR